MASRAAQVESGGRRGHLQTIGDAREVDDGPGTELVHHSGPVNLDRLLRGAEFRGNLLVQSARSDQLENLPLPRRQQRQALTEKVSLGTLCSRLDVQLDGFRDRDRKSTRLNSSH